MNQNIITDINIFHRLQSYEDKLVDLSKFAIIGFNWCNDTGLKTSTVTGNIQLLRPTGNATTHDARALRRPSNIKFVSVKFAMEFEDLDKAPCKCTFQTFFQLPIETRKTKNNAISVAVNDLTTFWGPANLIIISVDGFAAIVLLTSFKVGAASLKHPEYGMNDTSLDEFDHEYCYRDQVHSNVWPLFFNGIFKTFGPALKYGSSEAVTKFTQLYKYVNNNTTHLTVQMYFNNIFLQCCCINASKYDINVLHHVITHLEPDICTEV